MAGVKIVGKVGIRVSPDTSDFAEDLRRQLREMKDPTVPVKAELSDKDDTIAELRRKLAKLQAKAAANPVDIKTKVDDKNLSDGISKSVVKGVEDATDRARKELDELAPPKLFDQLRHQEIFNPSSMAQFQKRIGEINKELSATSKLQAQRLRETEAAEKRLAELEKDRIARNKKTMDDLQKSLKAQARLEAQRRSAAAAANRAIMDNLQKSIRAQAKLEAQRDAELAKRAKEEQRLLEERQRTAEKVAAAQEKYAKDHKKANDELDKSIRDLDRYFDKIVRKSGQLAPQLQEARRELDAIRGQRSTIGFNINIAGIDRYKEQVRKLKDWTEDEFDNIEAQIQPDVNEAGYRRAQQRLAWLARTRIVTLIPTVSKAGAAKAAAALAALSGARMIGENLRNLRDFFKDLDKNLPKIALLATGFLTLSAAILSGSSNLFALSASLAQIFPILLAMPGILGGVAFGLTALIVPLFDTNKELPELKDAWESLRKTMSKNFWAQARKPWQEMIKVILPGMKKGLADTSTEMGKFIGFVGEDLAKRLSLGPMERMFDDLAESINIAKGGVEDFNDILIILSEKGAGLLPRLSGYFVDVFERFSDFLKLSDETGALDQWIETAITRMKELGRVVYEAGRILGGLGRAAEKAGGSTLKSFGDALRDVADVVNSNDFQRTLVNVLAAAGVAMDNLATQSGPQLKKFFETFGETLAIILPVVGETAGILLGRLAKALEQTAVQRGLIDLFDGIHDAVVILAPAFMPLAEALGNLMTLIGQMAKDFAPLLRIALTTISDMFIALAPSIGRVVDALSTGLLDVFAALAPVLVDLAEKMAPVLEMIGTRLATILADNAPLIAEFVSMIGDFLLTAFTELAPVILGALDALVPLALELGTHLLQAVIDLLPYIAEFARQLLDQIIPAAMEAAPRVMEFVDSLAYLLQNLLPMMGPLIEFAGLLLMLSTDHLPVLSAAITFVADNLQAFAFALGGLPGILATMISAVINGWEQLLTSTTQVFANLISAMPQWGRDIVMGLVNGIAGAISAAVDVMRNMATAIIAAFKFVLGINSPSTVMIAAGSDIVAGLIQGISSRIGDARTKASDLATAIRKVFTPANTWLVSPGAALVRGLITGIGNQQGNATSKARALRDAIKNVFNNASSLLISSGQNIARGLASGIRDGLSWVTSAAESIARAAVRAAKWVLDEHSPSRVFFGIGQFATQGLAIGILDEKSKVVSAIEELADAMTDVDFTIEPNVDLDYSEKQLKSAASALAVPGESNGIPETVTKQFNFEINNPTAEPTSVTTNKALMLLAALGEE